jgi:hypothetical protein
MWQWHIVNSPGEHPTKLFIGRHQICFIIYLYFFVVVQHCIEIPYNSFVRTPQKIKTLAWVEIRMLAKQPLI